MYILYKNFQVQNYILKINYNKINLPEYKKYFNLNIINDFKVMTISLVKGYNNTSLYGQNLIVRGINLGNEEATRVYLQNLIFGNKPGREDITLKEILNEEKSQRFIKELCFILEKESSPIGYGQIIYYERKYYLVNFGIIPTERNHGFGSFFLNRILQACSEYGLEELSLTVDNSNLSAIRLYRSLGFKYLNNQASLYINSK
jgi:ribosomal protein S18 acetylase RimI-like enzyme